MLGGFGRVDFGVRDLQGVAKPCWLAEYHILCACGNAATQFAYALEPYAVECGGSVGEESD